MITLTTLINNKCNNKMVSNGSRICCDDEHSSIHLNNNNNCNIKMKSNGLSIFFDDDRSSKHLIDSNCKSKIESNWFITCCDDNNNRN